MAPGPDRALEAFFNAYAAASLAGDAGTIGRSYFSSYIEAAPSTVEAFTVDAAYEAAIWAKAEAMRGLGLAESTVTLIKTAPIAPRHVLAEAEWRLRFAPQGKTPAETHFRISYVVRMEDGGPKILLAISHEDEEQAMKDLGLS
jgi:hypothetical protein